MSSIRIVTLGRRVLVQPWEQAVVARAGVIERVLDAGRHRRHRREVWSIIDTRARWLSLATQDVLTADGMQVRVTPVVRYRVVDARAWLTEADVPVDAVYVLAQLAVREAVAGRTLEEVLAARSDVLSGVRDAFATAASGLGAEVLEFGVRDVTLSAELRHAFAETALAREQGRAKLERARSDAAALRSLANVAQVLEAHPALLQLRTLEAAAASGQFIVRIGDAGPVVVE